MGPSDAVLPRNSWFVTNKVPAPFCTGALPPSWAASFPALEELTLSYNYGLGGTVPDEWGAAGAFPALTKL